MSEHTCHACPVCRGRGHYYVGMGGEMQPCMYEDTDESESCDWCEGTGRAGDCNLCAELSMDTDAA